MYLLLSRGGEHTQILILMLLVVALGIRQHYMKVLSHYYKAIKRKEEHTEGNQEKSPNIGLDGNALSEKDNGLAQKLFEVLQMGNQGINNPVERASNQYKIAQSAYNVVSLEFGENAELTRKMKHLRDFLYMTEKIYLGMWNKYRRATRNELAMMVMKNFYDINANRAGGN